jgi:N-dimethylarginine dimethylaminohydrolase
MSLIGPDRILCCQGIFSDDFFRGFDVIEISSVNGSGANVICLGENEVIADDKNVGVMRTLAARGVMVHGINLSEFKKGGGGPTCLILPVERD